MNAEPITFEDVVRRMDELFPVQASPAQLWSDHLAWRVAFAKRHGIELRPLGHDRALVVTDVPAPGWAGAPEPKGFVRWQRSLRPADPLLRRPRGGEVYMRVVLPLALFERIRTSE